MVTILIMSAKIAMLGLLKIKLFLNNDLTISNDVIFSDNNDTNKVL